MPRSVMSIAQVAQRKPWITQRESNSLLLIADNEKATFLAAETSQNILIKQCTKYLVYSFNYSKNTAFYQQKI